MKRKGAENMGVKLILAEKPSMGRVIASAIGPMTKYDGYLEGSGYVISWAFGHLYELDDLEQYKDPNFKKGDKAGWKLSDLPFYPDGWQFRYSPCPDSGVKKQIRILKNLMNRKDIDAIYHAGDADREGEVIIRLVIDQNLKTEDYTDAEWKDILADATICTEATRANTIDRCIKSKYIELKKGCYHALEDGFRLVDIMKRLHIDLSPRRTADLSRSLHDLVAGKKKPAEVLDETRVLLDEIFMRSTD